MRLILNEEQLKLIKRLNEQTDFVEKTKDVIKDTKDGINKLYNIITFSTIAEIRDGDVDISIIEQRIEKLDDTITNIDRRVTSYYERYPEDVYLAKKLDDIHMDLENRIHTVNQKITALGKIVEHLKPLARLNEYGEGKEKDWVKPFDDITPTEV